MPMWSFEEIKCEDIKCMVILHIFRQLVPADQLQSTNLLLQELLCLQKNYACKENSTAVMAAYLSHFYELLKLSNVLWFTCIMQACEVEK